MRPKAKGTSPKASNAYNMALGERLRVEREAQKVILNDLAQGCGISINTIRWHEAGSRMLRADDLANVARLLKLDPQALMVPHYQDREADNSLRISLGRRMQSERALANKRQNDVVRDAHITITALQEHENGIRSLRVDELARVAGALDIDPSRLIAINENT